MSEQHNHEDQAQPYQPEFLPDLQSVQVWAEGLAQQAHRLHNSGQKIVSDFRVQWQSLVDEAGQLEADRVEAIRALNAAHQTKIARNERMRQQVENMIDFYTGHVATQQPIKSSDMVGKVIAQPVKQISQRKKFGGVWGKSWR